MTRNMPQQAGIAPNSGLQSRLTIIVTDNYRLRTPETVHRPLPWPGV
jgi:hypothetical protein